VTRGASTQGEEKEEKEEGSICKLKSTEQRHLHHVRKQREERARSSVIHHWHEKEKNLPAVSFNLKRRPF
jgi:hypothetical protein